MNESPCLDDIDPDFQYKDSNSSHSWLINYPDRLKAKPETLKISSKNEEYSEPKYDKSHIKERRKKLMKAFFRQIIAEELIAEFNNEKINVEPYLTDYTYNFKDPDDIPLPGECLSKNQKHKKKDCSSNAAVLEEMKAKYPLYRSTPLTFVSQITGKQSFRKNSTITKSPDQNYDNIEY